MNQRDLTYWMKPLYAAAITGHGACIRLLLGVAGINVNQLGTINGTTSLFRCGAKEGQETCTRLLLGAPGNNVNQDATNGMTPLCVAAAQSGHAMFCVEILLAAPGIDVNHVLSIDKCTGLCR